jgi:hypothetical protein
MKKGNTTKLIQYSLIAFIIWLGAVELGDRGLTRYYMSDFNDFNTANLVEVSRMKTFTRSQSINKRCNLWVTRPENGESMRVFPLDSSSFSASYCNKLQIGKILKVYTDNDFKGYALMKAGKPELFDKLMIWLSPLIAWVFGRFFLWVKP